MPSNVHTARDRASTATIPSRSTADPAKSAAAQQQVGVSVDLSAAIIAVTNDEPQVFVIDCVRNDGTVGLGLPSGPFAASVHGTLDAGLRAWVATQTAIELGYTEQLYSAANADGISIAYLALARAVAVLPSTNGRWQNWYTQAPWEDWRRGRPKVLGAVIEPYLRSRMAARDSADDTNAVDKARLAFGFDGASWNEERVLERFDTLHNAGFFERAGAAGHGVAALPHSHARVVAAAIGRLRSKVKARPVLFELMDDQFTLFELQKTVEAILGPHLHKQNFRRLVENTGLVEETGHVRANTGGRPAKLFRYRHEALWEG